MIMSMNKGLKQGLNSYALDSTNCVNAKIDAHDLNVQTGATC